MKIRVDTMGTICVRQSYEDVADNIGTIRRYHTVTFRPIAGEPFSYRVGSLPLIRIDSPRYRPNVNGFRPYTIVSSAVSFAEDDGIDTEGWRSLAEIPVGKATIVRHEYRVIDGGESDGGSTATAGRHYSGSAKITRYVDESAGEALLRSLNTWSRWEGAGVFDVAGHPDDATLRTVGDVGIPNQYGIPIVEHVVELDGEIAYDMETLRRELRALRAHW